MANTVQEERFRWLKPIINKEMKLVDVAKVCPHYSVRGLTLHTTLHTKPCTLNYPTKNEPYN